MNPSVDEIVADVQRQWSSAFNRHDPDSLAALYTEDAFLFGGKPALSRGNAAVRDYFRAVSPSMTVDFGEQDVQAIGRDVIASAGFLTFARDGKQLPYRMSLTLALVGADWKIASHHASPVPASPP